MGRKDRKKASEIHRETEYFLGKKVLFEEAFPEIDDIVVEVEERGHVWDKGFGKRRYTKGQIGEFIDCSNPLCYGGGFSIGSIVQDMVRNKQTDLETTKACRGNEASPKGKRIYRSCGNFFKIKVHIEYSNCEDKISKDREDHS